MNRRFTAGRVLAILAVAALAVPVGANAGPAPIRASVSHTATFVSPWQINLEVALTCDPGSFYGVNAQVTQPQGFTQMPGNGFASGQCSGQQQKIAVPVNPFFFPGWQLGGAVASVTACTFACDSETRTIRIDLR